MDNLQQIKHLVARAGFGLRFEDIPADENLSVKKMVNKLFKATSANDSIAVITDNTDYAMLVKGDIATKKMFLQAQRQQEKDLNLAWINKMSTTDAQLQEKMTLFWHNHFACRSQRAAFAQQLNNIQRANALGSFRTMLMQVSQSPAMLQFLNNQQNQKGHPNENFARELMNFLPLAGVTIPSRM